MNGNTRKSYEQTKLSTTNKPSTTKTNFNSNSNKNQEPSMLPESSSQESSSQSFNSDTTETTSGEFDDNKTTEEELTSSSATTTTTITPKVCIVMGRSFALLFWNPSTSLKLWLVLSCS